MHNVLLVDYLFKRIPQCSQHNVDDNDDDINDNNDNGNSSKSLASNSDFNLRTQSLYEYRQDPFVPNNLHQVAVVNFIGHWVDAVDSRRKWLHLCAAKPHLLDVESPRI